jgi:DNA polymerase delta subunit 2
MLEDESGRIRLIGKALEDVPLVTGVIVGVLGAETSGGDFEAVDLCFPGMAPQASEDDRMDVDGKYYALPDEIATYPTGHLQIPTIARETNT